MVFATGAIVSTQFCHAEVPLWDDLVFHIDGNSKITRENGTFAEPKPNAFSLPHISTCPGSTPTCRASCYVHGLEKNAPDVYRLYAFNAMALKRILFAADWRIASQAATVLATWIAKNAPGGFRWHVSGDVMHERHARWINLVCTLAHDVPFWIYTRTLDMVPLLRRAKNLVVNVSADQDNWVRAKVVAEQNNARICYFTNDGDFPDLPEGSVIFPDYELRGRELDRPTEHEWWKRLNNRDRKMVCPTDFFGQSEENRCGPCTKCLGP